jgi:hypothetical protein
MKISKICKQNETRSSTDINIEGVGILCGRELPGLLRVPATLHDEWVRQLLTYTRAGRHPRFTGAVDGGRDAGACRQPGPDRSDT